MSIAQGMVRTDERCYLLNPKELHTLQPLHLAAKKNIYKFSSFTNKKFGYKHFKTSNLCTTYCILYCHISNMGATLEKSSQLPLPYEWKYGYSAMNAEVKHKTMYFIK